MLDPWYLKLLAVAGGALVEFFVFQCRILLGHFLMTFEAVTVSSAFQGVELEGAFGLAGKNFGIMTGLAFAYFHSFSIGDLFAILVSMMTIATF